MDSATGAGFECARMHAHRFARRLAALAAMATGCQSGSSPEPAAAALSAEERTELVAVLERTQDAMLERVQPLDAAAFEASPGEGKWSVREVLVHLLLTEEQLAGAAIKTAAEAPDPDWKAKTEGKTEAMWKQGTDRSKKLDAPSALAPTQHGDASKAELVKMYRAARAASIAQAKALGGDVKARLTDHPRFGPLDARHWLTFAAAHTERHTQQMDEILAATQAPTP